jgi:homeobox protein LBX
LLNSSNLFPFSLFFQFQVITWFQNRRAKLKRDMEELKKDVESVKVLSAVSAHKTFLENVNDMNILKKKIIHDEQSNPHK